MKLVCSSAAMESDALSQEHYVEVAFRIFLARHRGDGECLLSVVTARIVAEQGVGIVAGQECVHRFERDPFALDDARIGGRRIVYIPSIIN